MPRVAIVFGSYNRFELLQKAVSSVRNAVGALPYEIIVVDGGSTDQTRPWLAVQPDVVLLGQRGPLTGAVKAFNLGFSYAVENNFDFVMHLNDDAEIVTERGIEKAVEILQRDPSIGEVAFAFDLSGSWNFDQVNGKPYANFGLIRREAGMAVASAQGDASGHLWWNPIYRTYGADSEFGVWLWKLGWKVHTAHELRVHDVQAMDSLRLSNEASNPNRIDSQIFWSRWRNEDYSTKVLPPNDESPRPIVSTKTVLVTGAHGFLGKALVRRLKTDPNLEVVTHTSAQVDLRDFTQTKRLFEAIRPTVVFHLAARCGGIGANQLTPATFFEDNMLMSMNVLRSARDTKVQHVVSVGTVCSYPSLTPTPFKEEALWDGYPEKTNAAYGIAKRSFITLAEAYKQQYGLRTTTAILANLYGPEDNFDLQTSHVIPALIRKVIEAKSDNKPYIDAWGTGLPTREFLFVDDAARALKLISNSSNCPSVLNIGSGEEVSIENLVWLIQDVVGYKRSIVFDASKPDGQRKRCLDLSKAKQLGFASETSLKEGLRKTIEWYQNNK